MQAGVTVPPLLKKAIDRMRALPKREQDEIAEIVLDELESEERPRRRFAGSPDVLARSSEQAQPH
jgi:hypothetical protein